MCFVFNSKPILSCIVADYFVILQNRQNIHRKEDVSYINPNEKWVLILSILEEWNAKLILMTPERELRIYISKHFA